MDILVDCHHYFHCCWERSFLSSLTQRATVQARHLASKQTSMQACKQACNQSCKHENKQACKQACKQYECGCCLFNRQAGIKSCTITTFMIKHLCNVLTVYLCKLNVGIKFTMHIAYFNLFTGLSSKTWNCWFKSSSNGSSRCVERVDTLEDSHNNNISIHHICQSSLQGSDLSLILAIMMFAKTKIIASLHLSYLSLPAQWVNRYQ